MKVDYDKIAPDYDNHRRAGGPYVGRLVELAREIRAQDVLELGCGTGNCTAGFLHTHDCRVIGLDPSRGMLLKAKAKGIEGVALVEGSATAIPLLAQSVDYVFGAFFLHHVLDLGAVARESARVLKEGGAAAFVTASIEFIKNHPMNRYFPSLATVDLARFQTGEEIAGALREAGFERVEVGSFVTPEPQPIDRPYVEKVAAKFISTYELIPADEFETGVARLRADVEAQGGRLGEDVNWEWTEVRARRL